MSKKLEAFTELKQRIEAESREINEFKAAVKELSQEGQFHFYVTQLTKRALLGAVEREVVEREYHVARLKEQLEGMLK